jgi:hypothetical protein
MPSALLPINSVITASKLELRRWGISMAHVWREEIVSLASANHYKRSMN